MGVDREASHPVKKNHMISSHFQMNGDPVGENKNLASGALPGWRPNWTQSDHWLSTISVGPERGWMAHIPLPFACPIELPEGVHARSLGPVRGICSAWWIALRFSSLCVVAFVSSTDWLVCSSWPLPAFRDALWLLILANRFFASIARCSRSRKCLSTLSSRETARLRHIDKPFGYDDFSVLFIKYAWLASLRTIEARCGSRTFHFSLPTFSATRKRQIPGRIKTKCYPRIERSSRQVVL